MYINNQINNYMNNRNYKIVQILFSIKLKNKRIKSNKSKLKELNQLKQFNKEKKNQMI